MGRGAEVRVTEQEKKLPVAEKLELINNELEELFQQYKEKGYSDADIQKALEPFWQIVVKEKRKWWLKFAAWCAGIIVICVILMNIYPVVRFVSAIGRLFTIMLLPLWDWRYLYYESCLVSNPYYEVTRLTEADCKSCEDVRGIEKVFDANQNVITYDYLYVAVPLIITDATVDWPAMEQFSTINSTYQVHLDNPKLKEGLPCELLTNLKMKLGDNILLLQRAVNGEHRKFYAIWQQCDMKPSKAMRSYLKRPYFLPAMVELGRSNWVLMAKDYEAASYKEVPFTTQVVYISQITGRSKFQLIPKFPCNITCHQLEDHLRPGETLLYVSDMWAFNWLPDSNHTNQGETIAVAAGGYFD